MDDPSAITEPIINGISANGKTELNGSHKPNEAVFEEVNT